MSLRPNIQSQASVHGTWLLVLALSVWASH